MYPRTWAHNPGSTFSKMLAACLQQVSFSALRMNPFLLAELQRTNNTLYSNDEEYARLICYLIFSPEELERIRKWLGDAELDKIMSEVKKIFQKVRKDKELEKVGLHALYLTHSEGNADSRPKTLRRAPCRQICRRDQTSS